MVKKTGRKRATAARGQTKVSRSRRAPERAKPSRTSPSVTASPSNGFPIVGIGASAGGLEAMTRLLRAMPSESRLSLVLVQHLDPRHESMLVDILSRETSMPVTEVRDGMEATAHHLYVIPPNASMELVDGSFRVAQR